MTTDEKLALCYEIIMLPARKGLFSARGVRTGYTHWLGPELAKEVRTFSGYVSESAADHETHIGLVLEHYLRIQTELTALVTRHICEGENSSEFISEVKRLEQVHIVTKEENIALRRKEFSGDYGKAGIRLLHWRSIPSSRRRFLRKKLAGKVSNANDFPV